MSIFAHVSKAETLPSLLDSDELSFTVFSIDDLQQLIQALDLNPQELLAKNRLRRIEQIYPGAQLKIPGWTIIKYIARAGDTITALSKRFNIPLFIIMRLNGLTAEATLQTRQVLYLPEPCL
ncbi:MAG: LysM peptidoglycan-binding domain-containing protein [Firmicutes bacterium]|nr:LysM peptidoglycan-binding domain-containing protein [Bacillota bacterium]